MESKPFYITQTYNKDFPILVVSTSAEVRLYGCRSEIEEELKKLGYSGIVLFDQIGCNGVGVSRFQVIKFDGTSFERRARRILQSQLPTCLFDFMPK